MYSIFLVDDEEIELEMMRDIIRWEEMGIYVAGTAINGKDAMEKIQVIQPDIVLTDVQMPIMNGIELAKQVTEQFDWMKIVFLTGHDEFTYVKSALNVGAVGYLLKPLDLDEIANVMIRVKEKCEEVRLKNTSIQVTKSNILKELIYEKNKDRKENLIESFHRLERRSEPTQYTMVLVSIDDHVEEREIFIEDALNQLRSFTGEFCKERQILWNDVSLREGEMAILMDAAEEGIDRKFWTEMAQEIQQTLPFTITLAVSEQYEPLEHIHVLYDHTKKVLGELFYCGYGKVIFATDIQVNFDSDQMPPFPENKLFEAVQQLEEEQVVPILQEYFIRLVRLRIRKKYIYDWALDLIERFHEQIRNQNTETSPAGTRANLYHSIYDCSTIYEIEEAVVQILKHTIDSMKDRFTDKNQKLVHQVSSIIQQTYHEQITITSLSSQVYLSPNYLRSIFKEKTGVTIHDYLTRIRLEKAKEMLSDPSLKVQDIAQKVGYESTSYFISLFLKSQGVTPNEYRKNL
ncbi:DNA-binding response regulator [Paenibacillus selenitireducens]|uniref:DNA-binding response regulator n=1 Tax=Paenibacillus selenitireducens TaxID=1324314 RepID=A0A1T2X2C0_9BACL|nr:response regulator [Paenibacillus selenitireducens]OPA74012.1 DNA-binding response regulator [Paenibacillus selenitireducens]